MKSGEGGGVRGTVCSSSSSDGQTAVYAAMAAVTAHFCCMVVAPV